MLEILSFVTGFLGPVIPQIFKWFERKQEYAQERALMELRLQQGALEHTWRMEEVSANADIAEMQTLRTPQQSFGVQLLDAAKGWVESKGWGAWAILPVFYFPVRDLLIGTAIALALGFVTGIVPALQAMRLEIAVALRRHA